MVCCVAAPACILCPFFHTPDTPSIKNNSYEDKKIHCWPRLSAACCGVPFCYAMATHPHGAQTVAPAGNSGRGGIQGARLYQSCMSCMQSIYVWWSSARIHNTSLRIFIDSCLFNLTPLCAPVGCPQLNAAASSFVASAHIRIRLTG